MNDIETRRHKAKQLRYKKPIVKNINLDFIKDELFEIQEQCEDVRWLDDEDICDMLGDEEEAFEFKMMFSDLCAECDQMLEDLRNEYIPGCFDDLFVAIRSGSIGGGLLGWDEFEQDYMGIGCANHWSEEIAESRIMRLNKKDLLEAVNICLKIYVNFLALQNRFYDLKASLDIITAKNNGYIKVIKRIDELYNMIQEGNENQCWKEWDKLTSSLPDSVWIQ